MQEKSLRGEGWDEMVGRWTKTVLCHAGKKEVVASLRQPNGRLAGNDAVPAQLVADCTDERDRQLGRG